MKYLFILNPISGSRKNSFKIIDIIDDNFKTTHHEYEFAFTTESGEAKKISQQAVESNFDVVVAAGGDGTINEVASGLVESSTALGIIPLGSGNGIARSYRVPLNITKSIKFLANAPIVNVDVGKVANHYFFGVCGLGYDAQIGKKFQDFGIRGPIPYFLIGLREFIQYKPEKFELHFEDKIKIVSPLLITISNTEQYGNGAIISPNADPRDGIFEICIINPIPVFRAISATKKLFNGKINEVEEYVQYRSKNVKIISEKEQGVLHTDGEPHRRQKITEITILNNALKVCANLNSRSTTDQKVLIRERS